MKTSCIVCFFVALVFCASASAEDYVIRLHRPKKVGERFKMEVTGSTKKVMTVTDGDEVLKSEDEEFAGSYDGEETILAVGANGRPVKISAKIAKLTKTERGKTLEVIPSGSVVIAWKNGPRKVYEMNGSPVAPEAAKVLELLLEVGDEHATDDEVFGTNLRKKVGDTWPVNARAAAADLEKQAGGKVRDITGSTTLEAVNRRASGDMAKISMSLKGTFVPPLPPSFTADASHFEAEGSGELPLDVTAQIHDDSLRLAMDFTGHTVGRSGNTVVMKVWTSFATRRKVKPAQ